MKCELKYGTHYIIKSIKEEFDFETIIAGMISFFILLLIYLNAEMYSLAWYTFGLLSLFSFIALPIWTLYKSFKVYKVSKAWCKSHGRDTH